MKKSRKLQLNRETMRQLDADSIRAIAGGRTETGTPPECIENTDSAVSNCIGSCYGHTWCCGPGTVTCLASCHACVTINNC